MPGYTGYIAGIQETHAKTPVMSQLEVVDPNPSSTILYARTMVGPKGPPAKDPTRKTHEPDNLWPSLQSTAVQGSLKPPPNIMALGDNRIDVFRTSYNADFKAPFLNHERLRSPNRNEDLAKTTADLKDIYASAYNRVGEKRLQKIISTMRERLEAKMGNQNNNAFKFRKLFQMYDKDKSGRVHYEDFRNMAEQFGMQLDDDSLLALYMVYDPEGTGYLVYHDLAKHLMDKDCYSLYVNDVDVSQEKVEEEAVLAQVASVQKKYARHSSELQRVLTAFDSEGNGALTTKDLLAGCAGLGLVLSEKDVAALSMLVGPDGTAIVSEAGLISISAFVNMLSGEGGMVTTKRSCTTMTATDVSKKPPSLKLPTHVTAASQPSPSPKSPAHKKAAF